MMEERQQANKSMREVQGGRVRRNTQMYKPLTQNIQAGCLVWYFDLRTILELRIQRDSILKIGMKLFRKKMNGRHQINGKGLNRWCFVEYV